MQVNFNQKTNSYNPNFKALTPEQIANHTRHFSAVDRFHCDVARGAIKLDSEDIENLTKLIPKLKEQGEIIVSRILNKILNPNDPI